GTEDRFFRFNLRRWSFRTPSATSKAEGMYCLYTAWRVLRSLYAAIARRARDLWSPSNATRIDSLTRRRNSARSQLRRGSSHVTGKERARWERTPSPYESVGLRLSGGVARK